MPSSRWTILKCVCRSVRSVKLAVPVPTAAAHGRGNPETTCDASTARVASAARAGPSMNTRRQKRKPPRRQVGQEERQGLFEFSSVFMLDDLDVGRSKEIENADPAAPHLVLEGRRYDGNGIQIGDRIGDDRFDVELFE